MILDLELENSDQRKSLFGNLDVNRKYVERNFNVKLKMKDNAVEITGDRENVNKASKLLNTMIMNIKKGNEVDRQSLKYSKEMIMEKGNRDFSDLADKVIVNTESGKPIKAKTFGQKEYVEKIARNDVVFAIGPAGTGKTYLAVAMAVDAFKKGEVKRIILTRPAVEAGESLGFLPGDLQDKVDPYLRPLYDALFEILGFDHYKSCIERGLIEVAPLAYMRGRTLDKSFVILDEAQNTTYQQMKMFLTRLGYGSKAVVTGDKTQVDLPGKKSSGLIAASRILKNVKGVEFIEFKSSDVVRHPLVQRIIDAYTRFEDKHEEFNSENPRRG